MAAACGGTLHRLTLCTNCTYFSIGIACSQSSFLGWISVMFSTWGCSWRLSKRYKCPECNDRWSIGHSTFCPYYTTAPWVAGTSTFFWIQYEVVSVTFKALNSRACRIFLVLPLLESICSFPQVREDGHILIPSMFRVGPRQSTFSVENPALWNSLPLRPSRPPISWLSRKPQRAGSSHKHWGRVTLEPRKN